MGDFGGGQSLCTRMRLWELPDQYVLEPTDSISRQLLAIDRSNGNLSTLGQLPLSASAQVPHATIVFGLAGIVKLLAGTYPLIITGRQCMGTYKGSPIYRVTSMRFLNCNRSLQNSTSQEKRDEAHFLALLKSLEKTPGLYFSYDSDLTLNVQRSKEIGILGGSPLWKQADTKYLWNRLLLEELIENKLEPFILPVIQGSFQTIQTEVHGKEVAVTLIARRCTRRIGTRMWRRGADKDGNVANFVETEQVLEAEGFVASYVQIRGSIPVLWEQIVDLTYKPKIKAINYEDTPLVVERHFRDLQQRYGDVLAIDLINQQGSEAVLSIAYGSAMQKLVNDSLRYIAFDFHRICGHIHFERLSSLYNDIREDLDKQGYYLVNAEGKILEKQKGVVRTNCIDCLDRTNVTQSLLGRKALEMQLQRIGVFEASECIQPQDQLDEKFKLLWADHGDEISIQYSGTQALKGDFVRYGRRTLQGLLQDGYNSLARYYYNNFQDGIRQDAMDLVAGHYIVSRGTPSPFQLNGFESLAYLPGASAVIIAGVYLTSHSFRQGGEDAYQYLYSVVLAGITAAFTALVRSNGRQFCNRPRLCRLN
ncbi:hypothetical protein CY35_07G017100 [Sphagnum magellanicum]|uniref:Uncharacterized protein n=1 Tax=Sphagnum magellanicum TaxID=128215 RepID=A0ACB8HJ48_9BRYO|nr:hypothetical protein CY35_07G017100 [Sphagnum magellanicum]